MQLIIFGRTNYYYFWLYYFKGLPGIPGVFGSGGDLGAAVSVTWYLLIIKVSCCKDDKQFHSYCIMDSNTTRSATKGAIAWLKSHLLSCKTNLDTKHL